MNCKYIGLIIGKYDTDFLYRYVLNNYPDVKSENIQGVIALNENDLLITYKNGKRELFDTFQNTRIYIPYETDALTEKEHRKHFPMLLRKWMERRFINQNDLARELGISQQMVSKYLSGQAYPGYARLKRIANVLKCSVEDLYLNFPLA